VAKSRKTVARAPRRRPGKAAKGNKRLTLSMAGGDPAQPAGLAEMMSTVASRDRGGESSSDKTARHAALKAAQARWTKKQKPGK